MIKLTPAEEQVMRYLWQLERAFFKELKAQYPEPQPATTTINTLLKRLIDKGFVNYKTYGNSREYTPLVSRNQYFSRHISGLIHDYFGNSIEKFGSFFTKEVALSESDLQKLKDLIDHQLKDRKDD